MCPHSAIKTNRRESRMKGNKTGERKEEKKWGVKVEEEKRGRERDWLESNPEIKDKKLLYGETIWMRNHRFINSQSI